MTSQQRGCSRDAENSSIPELPSSHCTGEEPEATGEKGLPQCHLRVEAVLGREPRAFPLLHPVPLMEYHSG